MVGYLDLQLNVYPAHQISYLASLNSLTEKFDFLRDNLNPFVDLGSKF